ncbi:MAG: Nitrogen permease regulator 2 [Claussenomyces sp. TS43310]|nr:MAG: Nitrogen permease regulator 2 [Claussenomyces sp. TS43310]
MIYGIFYARFLSPEGIRILHQSPPGCLVPEKDSNKPQVIDFEAMTEYIIPRQAFCNRYITVKDPSGDYVILGFPVCIKDHKYHRNELMFNFGIIVPSDYDINPYEAVVRRMAMTFTEMEIQDQYLSMEGLSEGHGRRSIGGLLEIIREDLNNYNECMIPVDDSNTINMKLFPAHRDPPAIKSWHVPIATTNFGAVIDDKWDLTMRKIIPDIDGISDVRRIAARADVSLELAKLALRHLIYHKAIILLDMFFFSNIYVPMEGVNDFINNTDDMQEECAKYVFIDGYKIANYYLCRMFTSFQHGRTVRDWLKLHMDNGLEVMKFVDVRRLVQFGVIKGILKRVRKFPISSQYLASLATGQSMKTQGGDSLQSYTDGCHSWDQIIVETNLTSKEIKKTLSGLPDVEIIYR